MKTLSSTYSFPIITIKESEKKEDYHKQFVQAIVNRSVADGYADRYTIANECVNFYLGLQTGEEFDFLQKAEDGDTLPAMWMNYNRINNKINIMLGELSQKKYEIFVEGINKELKSRKLQKKTEMLIDMRFQPIAQDLEQEFGMALQPPMQAQGGFMPQTEEELDDFFDREYKDMAEIVVSAILKYLARVNNWDYQRIKMFSDILIMGMAFCRTEIIDGIPVTKRVDPRNMIWDVNANDDFLSDSTYFGEMEYMSIGDVINQFGLTKKEIEQAYEDYRSYSLGSSHDSNTVHDFGLLNNNGGLRFFKQEGGDLRVLVARACWVDYKPLARKEYKDQFGQDRIDKASPDAEGKDIKKTTIKVWRQGTLIAGKFLKKWGEVPNQARNWTSLSNADAPYKCLIPQYMNGIAISKVHMMKNLQKLKDMALYRLQLDMARAGTKSFFYDVNQLPEGYSLQQVMKYMKTTGLVLIDSSGASGSGPTGFNQFKDIDLTMSQNIMAYLEISALMDREMDAISGINEARQGMVKNASQAVGVTQSSLFQSTLATAVYYDLFAQFCSHVLEHQAKLAKIAWAGKERFAPIIGEAGINFLQVDVDMDLHDYAVFIREVPPLVQDQQMFQQIILAAVQAGQLSFAQAMKLLLEKDVRVGVRQLEREQKKMMEQQAMMQQQAEQAAQQQQLAAEADMAERQAQAKQLETAIQNEADIKKLITQGRLDMKGQLLDFKKDLSLKKLDNKLKEKELNQKMAIDRQKANLDIVKAEKQLEIDEKKGEQQMKIAAQKAKQKPKSDKK